MSQVKKNDVANHLKVLNHVGLLFNEPPDWAGLLFIKSSENSGRTRCIVRRGSTRCSSVLHRLAKRILILLIEENKCAASSFVV